MIDGANNKSAAVETAVPFWTIRSGPVGFAPWWKVVMRGIRTEGLYKIAVTDDGPPTTVKIEETYPEAIAGKARQSLQHLDEGVSGRNNQLYELMLK